MNTFGNAGVLNVTSLREFQKSFKPKNQLFPAKNDLELLYEEKQPRQKWLLGKIVDLIPSQEGQIHGARVLLGKSRNTVNRLVSRLYPLKINFKFVLKNSEQNKVQEVMKEGTCRPKREAAELAKFECAIPLASTEEGAVLNSYTYLMYIIKHMRTSKKLLISLKFCFESDKTSFFSTVLRKIRKGKTTLVTSKYLL